MMAEEYDGQEGRSVWLSRDEVDALLQVVDDPLWKVAFWRAKSEKCSIELLYNLIS